MGNDRKAELRAHFLKIRSALTPAERKLRDRAIVENIRSMAEYQAAEWIGVYATDGEEPDLSALLKLDGSKHFAFPRYDAARKVYEMAEVRNPETDLTPARYGLLEPCRECPALTEPQRKRELLFLVPAVACDSAGTRLGRGGGFYDRLLAGVESPKIAVIYENQKCVNLPREAFDCPMDFIVTELAVHKKGGF